MGDTMNKSINILSRHNNLEDAISESGGLNREYNAPVFDKEVESVKKDTSSQEFYVVESLGRKLVLWQYDCDIKLMNAFSPYGASLGGPFTIGNFNDTYNCFDNVQEISNNPSNRKKIAKLQNSGSKLFVLNF